MAPQNESQVILPFFLLLLRKMELISALGSWCSIDEQ